VQQKLVKLRQKQAKLNILYIFTKRVVIGTKKLVKLLHIVEISIALCMPINTGVRGTNKLVPLLRGTEISIALFMLMRMGVRGIKTLVQWQRTRMFEIS